MLVNRMKRIRDKEDQGHEKAKEDFMATFKPPERSWECNICMVRNDRDKVECAACGSLKPGPEPNQEQTKDAKSLFSLGCRASSSEGVFSFGSFTTS